MTLQYKGGARYPGPLGASGGIGGRLPGPLGFRQVNVTQGGATKAVRALTMPPPTKSSTIMRARTVPWNLSKKKPVPDDVKQGELANCPLGAILAALAHTAIGKTHLDNIITEYISASVETTLPNDVMTLLSSEKQEGGNSDYTPQVKTLRSNRYFTVTLGNMIEVSDAFYVMGSNDTFADMVYMDSPTEALWPCVIEKAYAVKLKSYEDLDDSAKHPVEEFWAVLVGSKPGILIVDEKTDLEKIRNAAKAAPKIPTIGASRDDAKKVDSDHGYAVLGIQGSMIQLYNPWGKTETISLEDFRSNFERIYFGKP